METNGKQKLRRGLFIISLIGLIVCGGALAALQVLSKPAEVPLPVKTQDDETSLEHTKQPEATEVTDPSIQFSDIECPVDFPELQAMNPDTYAWLSFPEAEIEQPIVQRDGDEGYYLRRNFYGGFSIAGSVFSEYMYNGLTFEDPVTLLYGHCMNDGSMFGKLQRSVVAAETDLTFEIYLAEEQLVCEVFAAIPYGNEHILYDQDYSQEQNFEAFMDKVFASEEEQTVLIPEKRPNAGEQVVILSTCLKGNNRRRFLVLGTISERYKWKESK